MGVFYSFTVSTVPYITKSKLNVKLHIIYEFENTVLSQQLLHITRGIIIYTEEITKHK